MALVGLGLVLFLISKLGFILGASSPKVLIEKNIYLQLLDYLRVFVGVFIAAWIIPIIVKSVYKIKKEKNDYFVNYFRIQGSLKGAVNLILIALAIILVIVSLFKPSITSLSNQHFLALLLVVVFFIVTGIALIVGLGLIIASIGLNMMLLNKEFGLSYVKGFFIWLVVILVIGFILWILGLSLYLTSFKDLLTGNIINVLG